MAHYPVNLNLKNKKCLVVGGGLVGERKVETLLEFGAMVVVVSPTVTTRLRELFEHGMIRLIHTVYTPDTLQGAFLVIAATGHKMVNRVISEECNRRGIIVNVVDDPDYCSFFVPSVVRRGEFLISVSTSGSSPTLAKHVRELLEPQFGPEYGELTEILGQLRDEVKEKYPDMESRSQAYQRVISSDVLDLLKQGKSDEALQKARKCI